MSEMDGTSTATVENANLSEVESNPTSETTTTDTGATTEEQGTRSELSGLARVLKKDYQGHELAQRYGSATELFEAYLKSQEEAENAKRLPAADAPDEEWDKYRALHGRPENQKTIDYRSFRRR